MFIKLENLVTCGSFAVKDREEEIYLQKQTEDARTKEQEAVASAIHLYTLKISWVLSDTKQKRS